MDAISHDRPEHVRRVLFVTRTPLLHEVNGSTTFVGNLLELLARNGCEVTFLVTNSVSRSPRLWFRPCVSLAPGIRFTVPNLMRLGPLYLQPFNPVAWGRLVVRAAARWPVLAPLAAIVQKHFGSRLSSLAWDLTPPTEAELQLAEQHAHKLGATTLLVHHSFWAPLLTRPGITAGKRVIMMQDFHSERIARFRAAGLELDCPDLDEATELAWLNQADCVLAAQPREAETIRARIDATVLVQPVTFPARPQPGDTATAVEPGRCLFVGSNITPNRTGIEWFLGEVWPLIRSLHPAATLAVAGSICRAIEKPPAGVRLLGRVPAIEAEYARAAVCVVPLLLGSGIKIKLLEALSFGKAVVSTSVGVQGLEEWTDGTISIADEPASFAGAVVHLLTDAVARQQMEQAGLALAQSRFSAGAPLSPDFVDAVLG